MAHDAREIANFFLDYADSVGVDVTNLSLLKIIYFAHGWHLKSYSAPLVKNAFEAWPRGPVIRIIYDSFKECEAKPIKHRAKKFDPIKNEHVTAKAILDVSTVKFLLGIFDIYGKIDAITLSNMTHEPGGPWDRIMQQSQRDVCLQLKIPDTLIHQYFSSCGHRMS